MIMVSHRGDSKFTFGNTMPEWECPHCGKENRDDCYFEAREGHEYECRHCGGKSYISCIETIMVTSISTEKPK